MNDEADIGLQYKCNFPALGRFALEKNKFPEAKKVGKVNNIKMLRLV